MDSAILVSESIDPQKLARLVADPEIRQLVLELSRRLLGDGEALLG